MPYFQVPLFAIVEAATEEAAEEMVSTHVQDPANRATGESLRACGSHYLLVYQDEALGTREVPGPDEYEPHSVTDDVA